MKILIAGAHGQVGKELCINAPRNWQIASYASSEFDITNKAQVRKILNQEKPDYIVNAAAYTDVDSAEGDEENAYKINHIGPSIISKISSEFDIPLIHISTDYVFDGKKNGTYNEQDDTNPISVYGKSKFAGEQSVTRNCNKYIILRTSWVFGIYGKNFVKTMLNLSLTNASLNIVNDQFGGPTYAKHIALVIFSIIRGCKNRNDKWGIYHFSGRPYVSWFEFSKEIFLSAIDLGLIDYEPTLNEVSSNYFPTKAHRPKNSKLDCSKIDKAFSIENLSWKDGLSEILPKIIEELNYIRDLN